MRQLALLFPPVVVIAASVPLHAGAPTPIRIADTNTDVFGAVGAKFTKFDPFPSLQGGEVLFSGQWTDYSFGPEQGVFLYNGASVTNIADTLDQRPDRAGTFADFNGYSLDGLNAVFIDFHGAQEGLYSYNLQARHLTTLATEKTVVSSADGKLSGQLGFYTPSADGGSVAVNGGATNIGQGIYTNVTGTFRPLADRTSPAPDQPGYLLWYFNALTFRQGKVAFECGFERSDLRGGAQQGVYVGDATTGSISRIADVTTVPPGGGTWDGFGPSTGFDGSSVSFTDRLGTALYTNIGGTLRVAANSGTPLPGASVHFAEFGQSSLDGEQIAFTAASTRGGPPGLFLWSDGTISQILAPGGILDGKTIANLGLGVDALSGDNVAFRADFADGSSGIYLMAIPEPASCCILVASGAALAFQRRRPCYC